jgi:hypothetical protein
MTLEEQLIAKMRDLPPEKKREVLAFVDALKGTDSKSRPRRSLLGLWADLDFHVTDEDVAEARREMWSKFPREIKI